MSLTRLNQAQCFGGTVEVYEHSSQCTKTPMKFSIFNPPDNGYGPPPVLYWLSGLTCTEENFMVKSGAQQYAAEHGIFLVAPDTSPRGAGIPGEDEDWDFGTGAGFYVNATQSPWSKNYQMYDYVTQELPKLVAGNFKVDASRESIFGHSMGGHGALVAALRQPGRYRSVSAFAPICAPSACPWGQKAFDRYLGDSVTEWAKYDATQLISTAKEKLPILVDQGTADKFLETQLLPKALLDACKIHDHPLDLRMREGYDHSFYFISTFMKEHMDWHAKKLKG